MKRPNFIDIKSFDEFSKYYWYREELQKICKNLGLEYVGNKMELNIIIENYFNGVKILHNKIPKNTKTNTNSLSLETSVIECGFNFGPKFKSFFVDITGDKNFKYTSDMVATVKEVKNSNDLCFTLGDLLDIKNGKKVYAKYNNISCEWNKFLKDFCADNYNNIYSNKLKVASKFWTLLRNSNLPKQYSRQFIIENKNKIV